MSKDFKAIDAKIKKAFAILDSMGDDGETDYFERLNEAVSMVASDFSESCAILDRIYSRKYEI